ncbi:hypothetical protein V8G54_026464 [Vigna mungo]|uniref:Uncharacterized protein n=1 Tax=Vigna mungo TaxID=3915 RepID=A0AAQ3N0V0_VIGMU
MGCSYLFLVLKFFFRSYLCLNFFSSVCIRLFGSNMGVLGFEFDSSLQMGGGIMFPFSGVFVCLFFSLYIFRSTGRIWNYNVIIDFNPYLKIMSTIVSSTMVLHAIWLTESIVDEQGNDGLCEIHSTQHLQTK